MLWDIGHFSIIVSVKQTFVYWLAAAWYALYKTHKVFLMKKYEPSLKKQKLKAKS